MSGADHFLARWSRLKRTAPAPATEAAPATAVAPAAVLAPAPDHADAAIHDQGAASAGAVPAAVLPDPASLTLDSDFTAFLKDEVGDALRRQALKKLFNDPHFNVMDGLDIYIGDYSVSEPIPPELLAKIRSASEWLAEREDKEDASVAAGVVKEGAARAAADDAMGGAADGTRPPAGAEPAAAVDEPAPAAAERTSAALPPPATTSAAVPATSAAADTVEPR